MISMELQSLLEEMGCVVIGPVPSVAEAVVVSRTVELDAAIVDVVLRGEEAYPVAQTLVTHRIPFGFATGSTFQPTDVWKNHDHIMKPYLPDDVRRLLTRLLPHVEFGGASPERHQDVQPPKQAQ